MVTIYASIDDRCVMSKELFAPVGPLQRNREKFYFQTIDNPLIVSEKTFELLLENKPVPNHPLFLISEKLYSEHNNLGEPYAEHNGLCIFKNYQDALSIAIQGNRSATILGDSDIFQQAMRPQTINRMFLVRVKGTLPGELHFPLEITDSFSLVCEDLWDPDQNNPYPAVLQTYYQK